VLKVPATSSLNGGSLWVMGDVMYGAKCLAIACFNSTPNMILSLDFGRNYFSNNLTPFTRPMPAPTSFAYAHARSSSLTPRESSSFLAVSGMKGCKQIPATRNASIEVLNDVNVTAGESPFHGSTSVNILFANLTTSIIRFKASETSSDSKSFATC